MRFFKRHEPFIIVKETNYGLQTFVSDDVFDFNDSYKRQVITFLDTISKRLKDSLRVDQFDPYGSIPPLEIRKNGKRR